MHVNITKAGARRIVPESSVVPSSGHKLKHNKFHLNMRKSLFTLRVQSTEQAAQGFVVGFPGDLPNLPGYVPV